MFSSLKKTLLKPEADALKSHLHPPTNWDTLNFNLLPKGIDNFHYDVAFSPELRDTAAQLTRLWLDAALSVGKNKSQKQEVALQDRLIQIFQQLSENAVHQTRQRRNIQILQLFQLGITKFLLQATREDLRTYRQNLQNLLNQSQSGGPQHEKMLNFARNEQRLLFEVRKRLFGHLHKLELTKLRRLRQSLLGTYWPVPQKLIINPILLLPSIYHDDALTEQYHLLFTDKDGINGFKDLNRIITGIFAEYLPGDVFPPMEKKENTTREGDSAFDVRNRLDQGTLSGFLEIELFLRDAMQEEEYVEGASSWLDNPNNLLILFPPDESLESNAARTRNTTIKWRGYLAWLATEIQQQFSRAGILDRVSAQQTAIEASKATQGKLSVRFLYLFLAGYKDRKQLQRYLLSQGVGQNDDTILKQLYAARKKVRRKSRLERQMEVSDCLFRFANFRCDLKYAYQSYSIMDQIRVLTKQSDLDLSRMNNSLHAFYMSDSGELDANQGIINHTIIKADLRGSTRITEQLVKQGLNPATHFSLNFFDPINKLLPAYGAEKVFVEGDAVILSILEYGNNKKDWLCVSRACGLARKIIEVMDNQNSKNKSHGLPALEMGIGIAFSNGPPAFLYDGDHRIMISSAINRASQLSNCSAMLRNDQMDTITGGRGLRVVTAEEEKMEKVADDRLLRYNVNGIELDAPAFLKLQKELSLMKIAGPEPDIRYFMGRLHDQLGAIHTLVVRESQVRVWRDNRLQEEDKRGRRYYEVVTDPARINTATKLLNGQNPVADEPVAAAPADDMQLID